MEGHQIITNVHLNNLERWSAFMQMSIRTSVDVHLTSMDVNQLSYVCPSLPLWASSSFHWTSHNISVNSFQHSYRRLSVSKLTLSVFLHIRPLVPFWTSISFKRTSISTSVDVHLINMHIHQYLCGRLSTFI